MEAVQTLLAETGYAGLTMDAVAERAGVGKAAIYRRYPTKPEMVFATAVRRTDLRPPPDTGSLKGDLTALAAEIVENMSNPAASAAMVGLLADVLARPTLAERFVKTFIARERDRTETLLMRAVSRGELNDKPDPDSIQALLSGTAFSWIFMLGLDHHDLPERLARLAYAALHGPRMD